MASKKLVTGLSPSDEQEFVAKNIDKISDKKEGGYVKEILRATKAIAKAKAEGLDISDVMEEHTNNIRTLLIGNYSSAFDVFGKRVLNSVNKVFRKADPLTTNLSTPYFDMQMSLWLRWVSSEKVTKIADTTKTQALRVLRIALDDAVELGLDEKQTGALLQSRIKVQGGKLSKLRGRVIARTESHSAANASAEVAAKSIGVALKKEWISSGGERKRETHALANGQIVNEGEMFVIGSELLMYPGDPNGSAEEIINCRCVVGYSAA